MRAMRLERTAPAEEKPLRPVDIPAAAPGPGEVQVAVEACGVCRTDLHILEGEVAARLPVVPGHQAAGTVVAVGAGVAGFRAGDRVGVGWIASTCGRCAFCVSGRENLCLSATFTGRDRDGGYAERLTADARWTYPLPEGFAAREAAPLLCAGIIGYRSLKLSGIAPGDGSACSVSGPRPTSRSRSRETGAARCTSSRARSGTGTSRGPWGRCGRARRTSGPGSIWTRR